MRTLGIGLLVAAAACGPADATVTSGSAGVTTLSRVMLTAEREVFVLAVDDGADPVAAELRAAVLDAIADYDADYVSHSGNCLPEYDPAWWRPVDRRVLVVRPSQSGMARFISPLDDPALVWTEPNASGAGQATWIEAIARAFDSTPSSGGPYRLLEATHDAMTLLGGAVAPATAEESELVRSLVAGNTGVAVVVATGRDDRSPLAPGEYALAFDSARPAAVVLRQVIVPAESPAAERIGCELLPSDPAPARVAAWADQMLMRVPAGWPCDDLSLVTGLSVDCWDTCTAPRADVNETGSAACRVIARTRDQAPCPAERGWLDPLGEDRIRRPVLAADADGHVERVCEVQQLEGPALESCRTTLACEECQPGWCFTEVGELLARQQCLEGPETRAMRFVLGADSARNARIEIVCWHSSP